MLYESLLKIANDFELLENEGGSNSNVPNAADDKEPNEAEIVNKLDRSVKFDEVDTVTFGLETDDGKIVKVYVNAEQAEAFEKALATKLGEIDDIEEVLNELSKEYEIVDVEWPEGDENADDSEAEPEDDGSSALDQRVYGPKGEKGTVEDQNNDTKFQGGESLTYGEGVTLALLESSTSIESRFTTATQLMVYHAILDLGIPEISLARNPYRAAIIKGIKDVAVDVQKNASMKIALKTFIRRAMDFEKKAEENVEQEKTEVSKQHTGPTVHKDLGVKEEMKININEEKNDWKFTADKDDLVISSSNLTITLDSEETEKLIKGANNHDVVVVRDKTEEPPKKFVFSPRGSSILVKQVGSPDGYLMTQKDVEDLLAKAVPDRKVEHPKEDDDEEVKEGLNDKFKISASLTKGEVKEINKMIKDYPSVAITPEPASHNSGDGTAYYLIKGTKKDLERICDECSDNIGFFDKSDIEKDSLKEGLTHMGDKEYKTYDSWKAACKKCCETYWVDGNKDIAQAMVGPKPYKRGETKAIGEWDGEKGSVFKVK